MGKPGLLTGRQLQVVTLVIEGCTDREIAAELDITHRTARAHVAHSMRALGVTSRTQLAVSALRASLVPLRPDEAVAIAEQIVPPPPGGSSLSHQAASPVLAPIAVPTPDPLSVSRRETPSG